MSKKMLVLSGLFACFGMTAEIFFVAFMNIINDEPICGKSLWTLTGRTYVWMFFIYALIPIIGGFLMEKCKSLPTLARLGIYTAAILTVEFIAGFLLETITGACPWKYQWGWHVGGYIRLDYIPAWLLFAYIIESMYRFLDKHLIV